MKPVKPVLRTGENISFTFYTRFKVQMSPLITQSSVNASAVLQILVLPKILGYRSNAVDDSSLLNYDSV